MARASLRVADVFRRRAPQVCAYLVAFADADTGALLGYQTLWLEGIEGDASLAEPSQRGFSVDPR